MLQVETPKGKVVELRFRHLFLVGALVLTVVAIVAAILGAPWRPSLGWAEWCVVMFLAITCVNHALETFTTRERVKHNLTRRETRHMLYAIIGWGCATVIVMVIGGVIGSVIDPGW
ncbi:MAG TPA: hypothetical protein VGE30_02525 [Candidatus Saccharimonadales bacterium]